MRLRLATCQALSPAFHDDMPLFAAFKARGVEAVGLPWQGIDGDDPVAIRATWDYTTDRQGFLDWFDQLDTAGAPCINPTDLMRWNMDKRYLLDVEGQGHAIVPTRILESFDPAAARATADDAGWGDAIAKPIVGAGAEGLVVLPASGGVQDFNLDGNTWADFDARPTGACMVQPKLDMSRGEWSLFYFGGTYSHAVLKLPKSGDIRVQEEHGATSHAAQPPDHVRAAADAIAADQPDAVVARVDGVDVPDEGFVLMELEMIEPELFFRYHPPAVERYVDAVLGALP